MEKGDCDQCGCENTDIHESEGSTFCDYCYISYTPKETWSRTMALFLHQLEERLKNGS